MSQGARLLGLGPEGAASLEVLKPTISVVGVFSPFYSSSFLREEE